MEILGEDTKELDYTQFCTLLNESRNANPSRYSSFLNNRHMSAAIQFFKQIEEDEGDLDINIEEDEAVPHPSPSKLTSESSGSPVPPEEKEQEAHSTAPPAKPEIKPSQPPPSKQDTNKAEAKQA